MKLNPIIFDEEADPILNISPVIQEWIKSLLDDDLIDSLFIERNTTLPDRRILVLNYLDLLHILETDGDSGYSEAKLEEIKNWIEDFFSWFTDPAVVWVEEEHIS